VIGVSYDWPVPLMSLSGPRSLTIYQERRRHRVNQLLRVQNFNVSRDGFGAGEHQSIEKPFGDADPAGMFAWAGATASWPMRTDPGGSRGLDDYFTRDYARNIGAEIMAATNSARSAAPGTTTTGTAGGATSLRSAPQYSC
jgi:hypothetical protein